MAINLSQLSQAATTAVTLSNLVLVTPQQNTGIQAQNAPSYEKNTKRPPPTLLFNYNGEETLDITSDITDHYVENNSAIQDQISLKPEIYTVEGFVGELNDIAPAPLQYLKVAAEKLTTVSAYVPQVSTTALLAYANALQAYQVAQAVKNNATAAWASINGGGTNGGISVINGGGIEERPNQNKQQQYFQQLYSYQRKRTLFTIQTPWAIFQDMAIQSLKAVQGADTRVITDFKITFKMMRFASTQSTVKLDNGTNRVLYDYKNMEERASQQAAPSVNLGISQLQESPISFGSQLA